MNIRLRNPAVLVGVVLCCALGACKKDDAKGAEAKREIIRYTVRGQVVQVPSADDPRSEFSVRHEAIPEFRRIDGKLGMNTMTMGFPVAKGLSLEGIEAGDIVRLIFETEYEAGYTKLKGYQAVEVVELPAETALDFSSLPKPE